MYLTIGVAVVWFIVGAYVSYKFCKNAGSTGDE